MFFLAGSAASSALDLISALQQTLAGKNSPTASGDRPEFRHRRRRLRGGRRVVRDGDQPARARHHGRAARGAGQRAAAGGQRRRLQRASSSRCSIPTATARSASPRSDSIFSKNGDTTKADAIFAKLDANHDGKVSPDELTNALSGQGQDDGGQQVQHRRRHHHRCGSRRREFLDGRRQSGRSVRIQYVQRSVRRRPEPDRDQRGRLDHDDHHVRRRFAGDDDAAGGERHRRRARPRGRTTSSSG